MTVVSADFETGTNGNTLATGDTGSLTAFGNITITASSTLTYDTTHAAHGSLAAKVNIVSGSQAYFRWDTIGTLTTHMARGYFYFTANPPASAQRYLLTALNAGGSLIATVFANASGQIVLQDSVGGNVTMTTALPLNAWFRLEAKFIHSTTVGQIEAKIYTSLDSATADETKTSTANLNTGASATRLRIGSTNDTGSSSYWVDNVVGGSASYPGPFPANTVAPAVSGLTPVGSTLTSTAGTWNLTPSSTTYQWTRDGSNIAAATSSTYVTVTADAGHAIGCTVSVVGVVASETASQASSNTISVPAASGTAATSSDGADYYYYYE